MSRLSRMGAVLLLGLATLPLALAAPDHGLLLQDGKLLGWGDNRHGQLDPSLPAELPQARPLTQPANAPLTAVVTGARHSLALDRQGRVWAWGDNSSGQLGQGHTRPLTGPARVTALPAPAVMLAAGSQHSLALLSDGTVWAWGVNGRGQLGDGAMGAFAPPRPPAEVPLPASGTGTPVVKAIVAGDDFGLARLADGRVLQWGAGTARATPVPGLSAVQRIRARATQAMAQDGKGRFWQWLPGSVAGTMPRPSDAQAFAALANPAPPAAPSVRPAALAVPAKPLITPAQQPRIQTQVEPARADMNRRAPPVVTPLAMAPSSPVAAPIPSPAPVLPARKDEAPVPPPADKASAGSGEREAAVRATPERAAVRISGRVLIAGSASDAVAQAQISTDGTPCGNTDAQGRFSCSVPAGWSGRLLVRKNNFRFSPSALNYRNLQSDAGGQDFTAVFDPR